MFKHFFYFLLFLVSLNAQTGNSLKSPTTSVFDFTYNETTTVDINPKESIVEKVLIPISKEIALKRRIPSIFDCRNDIYGNTYCPESLELAREYTAYSPSTAYERTQTVIDFEQGIYQELTSTVRDFMDGFASTHNSTVTDYQTGSGTSNVGTVIDYQSNSTSSTFTGSVVDFASKVSSVNIQNVSSTCQRSTGGLILENPVGQWYSYVPAWAGSAGAGWEVYINKVGATTYKFYYRLRGDYKWSTWRTGYAEEGSVYQDYWKYGRDYGGFKVDLKTAVFYGLHPKTLEAITIGDLQNMPVCKSCGSNLPASELTQTSLNNLGGSGWLLSTYLGGSTVNIELSSDKTRYFYKIQAGNGGMKTGTGTLSGTISDSSYYNDGKWDYSINFELTSSYIRIGQWGTYSQVYQFNDLVCFFSTTECPTGYADNGTNCQKTVNYNYYSYQCPNGYTPVNSGFTSYSKSDPDTSNINDYTLDDAVNSATPPPSNCKKTITYSYYKYNCPTGYTINDNGLTSACPRTDPNNTTYDEASLSQPCNNSTPPTGNCEKIIPYTFYSYECSSGYTAIDKGLATCTKTDSSTSTDTSSSLDDPCNSSTPPKENCYKDISYKHYTYGCSPGYITDNYGLSTCPKTDPNKSVNNSATLDDDCNSKTPPPGNCRKSYSYKYYEYLCEGTNSFNENYEAINKGLSTCTKTDNDINKVNSELADNCNSSIPPINNCKSSEYSCDSTIFKPAFVDGNWKCSPYMCNGEMKCGYGTCESGTRPSFDKYQSVAYNPLDIMFAGACNKDICDYVMNDKITYCEAEKCPEGDGYKVIMGNCYKEECPEGTYLSGDKCLQVN